MAFQNNKASWNKITLFAPTQYLTNCYYSAKEKKIANLQAKFWLYFKQT
jgi:hypothetical protein